MIGRERGGREAVAGQAGRAWPKVLAVLLLVAGIGLSSGPVFAQSKDSALYIDPDGRVGIGTPAPQAALDVSGAVKAQSFEGVGAVPKGAILMWSGARIPEGWALCDGRNGTPDLRGRFVVAAGKGNGLTDRPAGQQDGAEKQTLTVAQMPKHSHRGTTAKDGKHGHRLKAIYGNPAKGNVPQFRVQKSDSGYEIEFTESDESEHQHALAIEAEGQGQAFSLMPPYYALAFIMKVE
jgi:microcystin-dependent protein